MNYICVTRRLTHAVVSFVSAIEYHNYTNLTYKNMDRENQFIYGTDVKARERHLTPILHPGKAGIGRQ